jgi:hypothetical protein
MIVLAVVIGAFCLFGVVLAWGEYQTRHFKRPEPVSEHAGRLHEFKKAA